MTEHAGRADTVVVLDFETTGLSPERGDRAIEVGAVRLEQGRVAGHFQQLINPGRRVNPFIERYTGISNAMLRDAPSGEEVMRELIAFLGDGDLVAHNASFDRRVLDAEMARAGCGQPQRFACSMLVARRLFPEAPNHKLGSLVAHRNIRSDGVFHRALADSEMTARLWLDMVGEVADRSHHAPVTFTLMQELARTPRHAVSGLLGC
jgi:DNA polymerase-3 subunit epsilon